MLKQLVGTSPTLEKAFAGEKLSLKDGLTLFEENEHVLGAAADIMRKNSVGDRVTFVASYYMNYTNVCAAPRTCSFSSNSVNPYLSESFSPANNVGEVPTSCFNMNYHSHVQIYN